jgi:tetratricopeptide (TPR) repeat protein
VALVEMPYAELLVEQSAFHLRNRRRSELSYSMLTAAIEILNDREDGEAQSAQQYLLLQAHNLAADAAAYASRKDGVRLHRAAADLICTEIKAPQNCHAGMATEVARTLAQQAHEVEAAGDEEASLVLFLRAVEYLRYATQSGAYNDQDYLELVRLYARIGRCHRAMDRQHEANESFEKSIEVLNQALTMIGTPSPSTEFGKTSTALHTAL